MPTWSYKRRLPEGRYLFQIVDVMMNGKFDVPQIHLMIPAGDFRGRRITAHLFPPRDVVFRNALGLGDGIAAEAVRGRFVRAYVRRKRTGNGTGASLIVEGWEAADMPSPRVVE